MPFIGEDVIFSAEFQNVVMEQLPALNPISFTPRPVTAGELPESFSLSSGEPPDPSYLGDSPYVLTGEYYDDEEGERHFQIWLWDSAEGFLIYTDELVAEDMEEARNYLPAMVEWVFSQISPVEAEEEEPAPETAMEEEGGPEEEAPAGNEEITAGPPPDDPLNRRLYLGFRAGISLGVYAISGSGDYNSTTQDFTYQAALFAAFRPLSWLSFQAEAVFTLDTLTLRSAKIVNNNYLRYSDRIQSLFLMFPLAVKFPLQYDFMLLSPYGGAYFILPLGDMAWETNNPNDEGGSYAYEVSPPLGVLGGIEVGFRLGPGLIFADLRYSIDLGTTTETDRNILAYSRSQFSLSLGYQFAFWDR
jgi:hypothetical protein